MAKSNRNPLLEPLEAKVCDGVDAELFHSDHSNVVLPPSSARTFMGRLLLARKDDAWARFNLHTEYVVSGSCADLIKAMIKVSPVMPCDVHLVATVHD